MTLPLILLMTIVSSCGFYGRPLGGAVGVMRAKKLGLVQGNVLPVRDALVVAEWVGYTGFIKNIRVCLYTSITTSDDGGRFSFAPWLWFPKPYPLRTHCKYCTSVSAYRADLGEQVAEWFSETQPTNRLLILEMNKTHGDERLHWLWALSQYGCDREHGDSGLAAWYEAIYEEAKTITPGSPTARSEREWIRARAEYHQHLRGQ